MYLLKNYKTGDITCLSDQSAEFMLESAGRDDRLVRHTPVDEADVGVPFTDEDNTVWLLFPMGPSALDRVVLFDQDQS